MDPIIPVCLVIFILAGIFFTSALTLAGYFMFQMPLKSLPTRHGVTSITEPTSIVTGSIHECPCMDRLMSSIYKPADSYSFGKKPKKLHYCCYLSLCKLKTKLDVALLFASYTLYQKSQICVFVCVILLD